MVSRGPVHHFTERARKATQAGEFKCKRPQMPAFYFIDRQPRVEARACPVLNLKFLLHGFSKLSLLKTSGGFVKRLSHRKQ